LAISAIEPPPSEIDLGSYECAQNPYPTYAVLRQRHPVCRLVDGSYALSRYEDVRFALKRHDLFAAGWAQLPMHRAQWLNPDCRRGLGLLEQDPPDHHRYRSMIYPPFSRRAVESLAPWARAKVQALVDRLRPGGEIEFLADFAVPFAGAVLAHITGLTEQQARHSRDCLETTDSLTAECPEPARKAAVESVFREQIGYFQTLMHQRRLQPQADLATRLVNATIDGNAVAEHELRGNLHLLTSAGYEPAPLLANAIVLLAHQPELLRLLLARPDLIPAFVEELLRFDNSTQAAVRTTTAAIELHGVSIPPRALVLVLLGAANRDHTQFPDPDRFQLSRGNIDTQLGFGHGVHRCLGHILARLEMNVALAALLGAFTRIQCPRPDELRWSSRGAFRTLRTLPVRFH
jgi:cytochrome P450